MNPPLAATFEDRLRKAWHRSDEIFALIPQGAWLERPIGLRHPFLFYLGHLPAFAYNQVCRGALNEGHLSPRLDTLYARGIDPESDQAAKDQSIAQWPSIEETIAYRDEVRRALLARIPDVLAKSDDMLCEQGRVLQLVVEHELMHHETFLYMIAEAPPGMITRPATIPAPAGGAGKPVEHITIPAGKALLGANWDEIPFGWDNEFNRLEVDVPSFTLDTLPVTNAAYWSFFKAHHSPEDLWPASWVQGPTFSPSVKTIFGPVPFDLARDWPVQVSGNQAAAYCEAHGGRLPTEAELHRAAHATPTGEHRRYPWGDAEPTAEHGNFNFHHHYPTPIGHYPKGTSAFGIEELVGNGWEWTQTPFAPLPGFHPWARTYPFYSTDFFDNEHDVVFGASFATDTQLLRRSFRNWYRRNYPYPFTSFRIAR